MTTAASSEKTTTARPGLGRYQWAMLIALVAVLAAAGYANRFAGCDGASKFCHIGLAGTGSEIVVSWLDGLEVYGQTPPVGE